MGNKQKAVESYQRALTVNSGNQQAREGQARVSRG
jgi:hypothetical protein